MSTPALIEFHNATIWRGRTCVFDRLNLRIEQHDCVAILGPNGCGKTTLLKTINRELYPVVEDDSWVRILGQDRWNAWELRRQIGVVSHDLQHRYGGTATAIEVVLSGFLSSIGIHGLLASRVTPEQIARAEAVLGMLDMLQLRDVPLASMSTGQQRRCLLGRALVHEPDTLIFDEPSAALDLAAGFDYLRLVGRLARQGRNIVIATHHLHEIPPEVDRVVLLKDGAVHADGSKQAILTPELLTAVYGTPVRVATVNGYYLAYPG